MKLRDINSPSKAINLARRESNFSMSDFKHFERKVSIRSPNIRSNKFIKDSTGRNMSGFRSPQNFKKKSKQLIYAVKVILFIL